MNNNNIFIVKASIVNVIYYNAFFKKFVNFLTEAGFPAEVEKNINCIYFAKVLFHKGFTQAVEKCFGLKFTCEWNVKSLKLEWNEALNNDTSKLNLTLPKLLKYLTASAYGLNVSKKEVEALPLAKEVLSPLPASKVKELNIIQLKSYFNELIEAGREAILTLPEEARPEAEAIKGFRFDYYVNGLLIKGSASAEAITAEVEALDKALREAEAKKAPKPPAKKSGKPKAKSPAPKGKKK